MAVADADQPALFMVSTIGTNRVTKGVVHLAEKNVVPVVCDDDTWVLDTGASNHMTGNRVVLSHLNDDVQGSVKFGDGSCVEICGIGSVVIEGRHQEHKVLSDVYYIPKLKSNIVSLGQLEEGGCDVRLCNGRLRVFDREENLLISAPRTGNRLYTTKFGVVPPVCLLSKFSEEAWRWHARFGHLNFRALRELGRMNMVDGMPMVDRVEQVCDGCTLGKQHRSPFPQVSNYRAERGLELIHADLYGQVTPQTFGGCSYFLLVVDDYSRYMWVEMLKTKDQALTHLKKIKERAEVDRGVRLKAVRTDRGGEFNSTIFTVFCNQAGIKHYTTTPYSPQQNGVVERRNQTVVEMARCMLKSMKVPPEFWGEAVATAVYVLNRSPTKSLKNKTPFEAWHGKKPRVDHLRTFGCTAHVKVIGPGISKLSDRSKKMVFLGYEPGTKGYRLYDPDRRRLVISRDVLFEEDRAWEWEDPEDSTAETETFTVENFQSTAAGLTTAETEEEGTPGSMGSGDSVPQPLPHLPGSPSSVGGYNTPAAGSPAGVQWHTPPDSASSGSEGPKRYRDLSDLYDNTEVVNDFEYSGLCLLAADEPASIEQALGEQCWREAMAAELQSIKENKTWEVSELPKGQKAIGLKWVFKVKKGSCRKHSQA